MRLSLLPEWKGGMADEGAAFRTAPSTAFSSVLAVSRSRTYLG
jgi:hypothetical protein